MSAFAIKKGCTDSEVASVVYTVKKLTRFAGSSTATGSTNGIGTAARFDNPYGIASDGTNLYVADTNNHTIRKIVISTGVVTTLAGTAGVSGTANGTGAAARFNLPKGLVVEGANLYVAEYGNHAIRKIVISTGVVTTYAGTIGVTGFADGIGTAAVFWQPTSITSDGTNLYVADFANHLIRKIVIATAQVSTFAGVTSSPGSDDGIGTAAKFRTPFGITTDGTNLYVTEFVNCLVRKIVISTREVTTFAGLAMNHGSADGIGFTARFYGPKGITNDGTSLYVADGNNQTIRKINMSTAEVTTYAGLVGVAGGSDGTFDIATFSTPTGIVYTQDKLFVTETGNSDIRVVE